MTEHILSNIFMTSGVNEEGKPFITISAHGDEGTILIGQLSPEEIRQHAMSYLESAEAAEQDAALFRIFRKLELPDSLTGMVITELRNSREGNE